MTFFLVAKNAQNFTNRDSLRSVVVYGVGLGEPDDDRADLLLHVALLHQPLLEQHQKSCLRRLANLQSQTEP